MSRTIGAEKARQTLPELLDRASAGESTIITRRGRPCAVLVPLDQWPGEQTTVDLVALAGSGKGLWGDDPAGYVRGLREEWS